MNIYEKLLDAKKEIGKISKDSKNPFFKSNYLSLNGLIEAISPALEANGLLLLQPIEDGVVKTVLINAEDKETVSSSIPLGEIKDPQKLGSAITYYRRYTLQSLLGLQAEDDDGNNASKPPVKPTPKKEPVKPIPSLTKEQFEKTLKADKKGIEATLKLINSGKMCCSKDQKETLVKTLKLSK